MSILHRVKHTAQRLFKKAKNGEIEYLQQHGLTLGAHVDIFSPYCFDSIYPGLITVGNYVTISSNVKILAHDASMGYVCSGTCKIGTVTIGDHVFIGQGTTILCNTRIGDYVVIGAGSVVVGDIPSGSVYAGNPARFIKTIDEFREQHDKCITTHPTYSRPWQEFANLSDTEWEALRADLKDTYGYIVRK